nr:MAG: hypothetical protein [Lokiarchaeota virus Skoll Meg22_1214]
MHLLVNFILMLLIFNFMSEKEIVFSYMLLSLFFGALFPDLDFMLGKKYHRFFLFHSIILLFPIWLFYFLGGMEFFIELWGFLILNVGIHLVCDVRIIHEKRRGSYTIKFYLTPENRVRGLRGKASTTWLVVNFIMSIFIFIISIYH